MPKRKTLSAAFFKKKLTEMTKIIKKVTLEYIREVQDQAKDGRQKKDLVDFTTQLQSKIFLLISVGKGLSQKKIPYERDDGTIEDMMIVDHLNLLVEFGLNRYATIPYLMFFPELFSQTWIHPADRRWRRNLEVYRARVKEIMKERRAMMKAGKTDSNGDFLSILLTENEIYDNDEKIVDEIITFSFAGFKTIQVSTTNMIYYLTMKPELKQKLLAEVMPKLESVSQDFINEFD